jgi:hypothetical protein
MGDQYKFQMIRSDDSAQILTCHTAKVQGVKASDVIESFTDFLQCCGYHRTTIMGVYQRLSDELSEL